MTKAEQEKQMFEFRSKSLELALQYHADIGKNCVKAGNAPYITAESTVNKSAEIFFNFLTGKDGGS